MSLKKEWFDKILSGQKNIEYREYKPYWIQRLKSDLKKIVFINGYGKHRPSFVADVVKIDIVDGINTDLKFNGKVFAIHLCNIIK
jgi:hypothetical protein